jgi:CelD/BcsL family acetyltransferase involved in cellulose biosynthesis
LLRIIEDLVASGAQVLDFGSGHADYKELLATRSYYETSALLVRRTAYAQGIAYLQRGTLATAAVTASFLDRFRVKSLVKNWMRRLRLRPTALAGR